MIMQPSATPTNPAGQRPYAAMAGAKRGPDASGQADLVGACMQNKANKSRKGPPR